MNKKLIKSIVDITCGLGATVSIPFTVTNCACSQKNNPLPDTVYNIDANNVLKGFKEGINLSQYDGKCNTMEIPANVTSINAEAFINDTKDGTTIPPFITKLIFPKNSNCSSIGMYAFPQSPITFVTLPDSLTTIGDVTFGYCFSLASINFPSHLTRLGAGAFQNCTSLTSVTFPSSLMTFSEDAFKDCSKLKYIAWDLPTNYINIMIKTNAFVNISLTGKVESLNPQITSQQFLDWIKTKGGFPTTGWDIAN